MSLINGTEGDWGPDLWTDPTGNNANNGPQVQANDVLTQSTVSDGPDKWTGFFQNLIGTTAKYAIQRDAVKSGLQQGTAANGQPIYSAQPAVSVGGMNTTGLLIIGGAIVGAVLLVTAKKG